jgi:hypothetical protein
LKDHYIDDIALQAYVLRGAGVAISSIELLHVNTAYVRGPDDICWMDFFTRLEVEAAVVGRLVDLPGHLPAMRDCLAMTELPDVQPGTSVDTLRLSSGTGAPRTSLTTDHLSALPDASRASALAALGISPSPPCWDFPHVEAGNHPGRDGQRAAYVSILQPAAWLRPASRYLDFEAMMPPTPSMKARPYQTIPFQWSLHAVTVRRTAPREFLAGGDSDQDAGSPKR